MAAKIKTIFDQRYRMLIKNLVKLRHERKLSQNKLAKMTGYHNNYIARIELCERRLDIVEMIDYMRHLGMSDSDIIKAVKEIM